MWYQGGGRDLRSQQGYVSLIAVKSIISGSFSGEYLLVAVCQRKEAPSKRLYPHERYTARKVELRRQHNAVQIEKGLQYVGSTAE